MPYVKQIWANGVMGGTPLSAERLAAMEKGILQGGIHDAVENQPTWDSNAANNDAAYLSAMTAATTAGGGPILLPKQLKLSSTISVPANVNLIGRGAGQVDGGSQILLTTADASVKFGTYATPSFGGISSGFHIKGQNVANIGLHTGIVVGRTFQNIDVTECVDTCQYVEGSQNNKFIEVNCQIAGNDTIRVDKGAGSNSFDKCEYGQGSDYILNIVATDASPPLGLAPGPLNNVWSNGCIFEYDVATTLAMVRISAGTDNIIADSTIASGYLGNTATRTLIKLEVAGVATVATFKVRGGTCQFNFVHTDTTVLNQAGATRFYQEGKTTLNGPTTVGRYNGASALALWDAPMMGSSTWSVLSGGAPYYNIRRAVDIADSIAAAGAGTYTKRRAVFLPDGTLDGYIHLYSE